MKKLKDVKQYSSYAFGPLGMMPSMQHLALIL